MKKYKQTIEELAEEIIQAKKLSSEPWSGIIWISKMALKIAQVKPEQVSKQYCESTDGYLFKGN